MKQKMTMITIAILGMSIFSLQAGVRIGAKAGVNLANVSLNTDAIQSENFTGFQVGPIVEFSGLVGFGIDAAILYSQQGLKLKEIAGINELEEKVSSIDIPVNLKYKLSFGEMFGVYLSAGPYIGFKVDGQTTFDQIKANWDSKQFGVGLNFGAGIELIKHLQIGANYQLALNDDYSNNTSLSDYWGNITGGIKGKTRIWSITATYFF